MELYERATCDNRLAFIIVQPTGKDPGSEEMCYREMHAQRLGSAATPIRLLPIRVGPLLFPHVNACDALA
eukprot:7559008-Pyramimonas_sp.AAC.1